MAAAHRKSSSTVTVCVAGLLLTLLIAGSAYAQPAGVFTPTGNMTTPRFGPSATLLNDGRVLIAGGSPTASVELYDPATGTFTATATPSYPRRAVLLPDGKVLIGGVDITRTMASVELYDPSSGTLNTAGKPATLTGVSSMTLLNDGRVLLIGTVATSQVGAELYDPATDTFTAAGVSETPAFSLMTETLLADERVLITGCQPNCGADDYTDMALLYDPATHTFSLTGSTSAAFERTETLLSNGKVLFAGGVNDNGYPYRSAQLYDPSSGAFSGTGDMTKARSSHTATLLPDGTILIAGGGLDLDGPAPCCVTIQTAESYDPASGTFGSVTRMVAPRGYHTATLLNDGRVLLAGGLYLDSRSQRAEPPNILASAEIYTPPNPIPAAALLSLAGDGQGQGFILHNVTGQLASPDNPAAAGETVQIYCAGLMDGSVISPQVTIGGRVAEIVSFGNAPGWTGVNQVNVRVPSGVISNTAVGVRLRYFGRSSNEVTIAIQ
jgi:hypothetical protein